MSAATRKNHTQNRHLLLGIRRGVQLFFVGTTTLIGLSGILIRGASNVSRLDAFCPFGGIETLWAYLTTGHTLRTTNLFNFALLISVVGASILSGRSFCGWICPIGTLQDLLASLSRRLSGGKNKAHHGLKNKARFPLRVPQKIDKWLRYLKYFILLGILIASTMTLYPPLYHFCPVRALFGFHLSTLLWVVLITFIITSMLIQRFWCKYLCPLGALLAVSNKIAPIRIVIDKNRCTNCHICETECPVDITPIPENMRSLECVQCLECLETCPKPDTLGLKLG